MRYKLAFNKTHDGLLKITTSIGGVSEKVISIYESDQVFLSVVKQSDLDFEVVAALEEAVNTAFSPAQTPSCCEEVELSDDQLIFLRLGAARRLYD
jgi:ArsR family metal-binding transcriptional regulator